MTQYLYVFVQLTESFELAFWIVIEWLVPLHACRNMYFHPLSCWFVYTIQKLAEARELTRGEVNEPLDAARFWMQSGDFMYSKWWWSGCLCWICFPGIVVQDLTTGWKSLACAELWSLPGVRQLPVRLPYHAICTYVNTSPGKPLAAVFGVSIWEDRPDGCPKHLPKFHTGRRLFWREVIP